MDRTEIAVRRQVAAMGSTVFEVGLYKPDAAGQPVMIPRVWDQDALLRSISWLRLQNMHGRNIYIRPKGEHDLSLVDDLRPESIARMKAEGFQPAAVVETSPGNFQAWLKHPSALPREVSTAAARDLASRFDGDLGAADWRHFGRLAGFTNRKPKYAMEDRRFPFVRVMESSGERYRAGSSLVKEIEQIEATTAALKSQVDAVQVRVGAALAHELRSALKGTARADTSALRLPTIRLTLAAGVLVVFAIGLLAGILIR